jgi:hypothetical protein
MSIAYTFGDVIAPFLFRLLKWLGRMRGHANPLTTYKNNAHHTRIYKPMNTVKAIIVLIAGIVFWQCLIEIATIPKGGYIIGAILSLAVCCATSEFKKK